jgi:carbon monoxide dehydrogenase subunit G
VARFREVIEVSAPLERAFAFVADFTTAAEWDPGIAASRRTGGDGGVGTTYAVEALFRGKTLPFEYVVTAYEIDRVIVLSGAGARATSIDTITFESITSGGTRITYEAELRFTGMLRVIEPLFAGTIRTMGAKALAGLRDALNRS